jgi:Uma2 family endonuclease
MNDSIELKDEAPKMGSYNHSLVQARIPALLSDDDRFSGFIELSLDASQIDLSQFSLKTKEELKPDICFYPKAEKVKVKKRDLLKMAEMPLLAIEIISPKQGIDDILAKFEAYFALGVKSCWLIMPSVEIVDVYSQLEQHRIFDLNDAEIIDEVADIRLPIQKIFEW